MSSSDALDTLPTSYAVALRLADFGADAATIGAALAIAPEQVAPLLQVGRRKLGQLRASNAAGCLPAGPPFPVESTVNTRHGTYVGAEDPRSLDMTATTLALEFVESEQPADDRDHRTRDDGRPESQPTSIEAITWLARRLRWERRLQELQRRAQ